MNSQVILPSLTLYRRNCYGFHTNYLAYLSSTTQINLIEFTSTNQIANVNTIKIPLQPVKAINLYVRKLGLEIKLQLAVAFLTRFIIFVNNKQYHTSVLQLDKSIVDYNGGFVAVERYKTMEQEGFIFALKTGEIILFNLDDRKKTLIRPTNYPENITSMASIFPNFYLGTQNGFVKYYKVQEGHQIYADIASHDTTSRLPIINLAIVHSTKQLIATTCQGEVYIFNSNLLLVSIISAHHCLISRILVNKNILYTAGEDMILNKFQLLGDRKVKLLSSESSTKLISLLFNLNGKTFLTYYETPKLKQV